MTNNVNFINIREILSRVTRHPLMSDIGLESAIQYTLDFIAAMGLPKIYVDKVADVDIENYRALLPCDLISIIQVRTKHGDCRKEEKVHSRLKAELYILPLRMAVYK